VQVRRRGPGIAGVADVTDNGALGDVLADVVGRRVTVEMSVVVGAPAGAQHRYGVASQSILADTNNDARSGSDHGRAPRGENVLAFVQPGGAPAGVPGVGDAASADTLHRHGEARIGRLAHQPCDPKRQGEPAPDAFKRPGAKVVDQECDNDGGCCERQNTRPHLLV
jgi:hypothetical protein